MCLVLGAGIALSGGVGVARALAASPSDWFSFGFEALLVISGLFGVGCGLGKYREGPALAMVCVAGATLVAAALGYTVTHKGYTGILRDPYAFARLAAAASFGALAALTVMARRPHASAGSVFRGVVMAALACATGAALALPGARAAISGLHPVLAAVVFLALGVLLVVFISASAHNFIRALEHGREPLPPGTDTANPGA